MSLIGIGLLLILIGIVLWLATIAPGLGYLLIIVGVIIIIVAAFLSFSHRRRGDPL